MTTVKLPRAGPYAKFLTATAGQALVYLYTYGWAWHIKEAALLAAVALGVYGIPNTPKPAPPVLQLGTSITGPPLTAASGTGTVRPASEVPPSVTQTPPAV